MAAIRVPHPTDRASDQPLLRLSGVTKYFGGLAAVQDVDMEVRPGQILSVIGPNGAGKSTLFNLVTGVYPVTRGEIQFAGARITGLRPHQVARLGINRTFQTTQVFPEKTVLENVLVGRHTRVGTGLLQALVSTPGFRAAEAEHREKALQTLALVQMADVAHTPAALLPTALQQRLAIAMAMAPEPALLLLDEPTGGLVEQEVQGMMDLVRRIRDRGTTVVLIEHKMRMVMQVSDHIVVLHNGIKICEGTPDHVAHDEGVVEAYLGKDDAAPGVRA